VILTPTPEVSASAAATHSRPAVYPWSLAMTTPGDTSMATLAEVERRVAGRAPWVDR
jgi:hypothetical protein